MKYEPVWKLKVQQLNIEKKNELAGFMGISTRNLYRYLHKPGRLTIDLLLRLQHFFIATDQQEYTIDQLVKTIPL